MTAGALTGQPPAHLPDRLTITLWDFSWYTRAGAGEPFADLDEAFRQAADRGYNTVRICAATLFLFGDVPVPAEVRGRDANGRLGDALTVSGLGPTPGGGYYGQRTRWYDTPGGFTLDLRQRLFDLFDTAARHGFHVIVSTWEYQQSPAFSADDRWWRAIDAVPLDRRYDVLAEATVRLLDALRDRGSLDAVAFVELHNEVDFSRVPALADGGEKALAVVREAHPDVLVTASYGKPPHLDMAQASDALDVAQFHVYSYGVLDELQKLIDLRDSGSAGFPNALLRGLQLEGAPTFADYGRPEAWRLEATVITDQMLYGYDFLDPVLWDRWLYDHVGEYRVAMRDDIANRVHGVAAWARRRGVPMVVGEGWVGYTPLLGSFEEGPIGTELAEHGVETALEAGVWGMVLCSNAAPHHPMWSDVAWQRRLNARILAA